MKRFILYISFLAIAVGSCNESWLEPKPLSFYAPELVLYDADGMLTTLTTCNRSLRIEFYGDAAPMVTEGVFSDIAVEGTTDKAGPVQDMNAQITPSADLNNGDRTKIGWYWIEGYYGIKYANTVISYIDNPTYSSEAERNSILGMAYFHRAYRYYRLTNQFGDVPFAGRLYNEPKLDFRSVKREVILEKIQKDLEKAVGWTSDDVARGQVTKGACQHLLIKVYLALGKFDEAIDLANKLISDSPYALLTGDQFGSFINPYPEHHNITRNLIWDMHRHENKAIENNTEVLYMVLSREELSDSRTDSRIVRNCVPFWSSTSGTQIYAPDGSSGGITPTRGQEIPLVEMYGRGIGRMRSTSYYHTHIWDDPKDLRHDRASGNWMAMEDLRFNNKSMANPAYYGTNIKWLKDNGDPSTSDSIRNWYPWPHYKVWYPQPRASMPDAGPMDWYVFRLAETYLLRAEAYWWKGQISEAMADVNIIRQRAGCDPYTDVSKFDILTILAERARELYFEEPRKTELTRVSFLFAKTGKPSPYGDKTYTLDGFSDSNFWYDHLMATTDFYNKNVQTIFGVTYTMSPYHVLWPVYESEIQANVDGVINQNKGYSGYEKNEPPLDYISEEDDL